MKIVIVGIGAIGSHLAEIIACWNPDTDLTLVDFDTVEENNLRNGNFFEYDVKSRKTNVIANRLYEKVGLDAVTHSKKIDIHNCGFLIDADLVIDCVDNSFTKNALHGLWASHSFDLLHTGITPDATVHVIWAENWEYQDETPRENNICTGDLGVFAGRMAALYAGIAVDEWNRNIKRSRIITPSGTVV